MIQYVDGESRDAIASGEKKRTMIKWEIAHEQPSSIEN
jgi:hypothetical protein